MDLAKWRSCEVGAIRLEYGLFTVKIRNGFRTAHTFTTERNNFIIHVKFGGQVGSGQAGLPPKKPGCYLADPNDCIDAMAELYANLTANPAQLSKFELLDQYFSPLRADTQHQPILLPLLGAIHALNKPEHRACKSAAEFAVLDLWSRLLNKSMSECIYGKKIESNFRSFFTVSFNEDVQKMLEEAEGGMKHSPYIKIKMNNDLQLNTKILQQFKAADMGKKWVIDANASWSVETAKGVLEVIAAEKLQERITYIEQPFPLNFANEHWQPVRKAYNNLGIKIMADESFASKEDVMKVGEVADAVNIKIQKTGGLTEALQAISTAKSHNKTVWIGSMISSHLGCTQAYQLYPYADFGDLDGGWLTISPYTSGFIAAADGLLTNSYLPGTGCSFEQ